MIIPPMFLAVDALMSLYLNVVPGLVVHPAMIARHLAAELPFMATENVLMAAVQAVPGDRQDLHERHPDAPRLPRRPGSRMGPTTTT